ncbi:hypothetical protein ZPAH1_orf00001 [Aeromonas phage ZPAH1]|nr:hypothetical protein ZPAH1_orf00001 [Aeromonas phage ZPAH1]
MSEFNSDSFFQYQMKKAKEREQNKKRRHSDQIPVTRWWEGKIESRESK